MKPNYYAVIPAEVRYSNKLTPNSKLIYGEITCLTQSTGKCFATNRYFANLYEVSEVSVSKWINQLAAEGFIKIQYDTKENKRYIELATPLNKSLTPLKENLKTPLKEKFKTVNTNNSINNTSNNNTSKKKILKEKSYSDITLKCYEHILPFFGERIRPKTKQEKQAWLDCIVWAKEKKGCDERMLFRVIEAAKKDDFTNSIFRSLRKIKNKNKDGINYLDLWIDIFKIQ